MNGISLRKLILVLSIADVKNISRDPILLITFFAPLLFVLTIRWVGPLVASDHHIFLISLSIIMAPLMLGMATGFMLLEDRDEHVLKYMQITPLQRSGYLSYRLLAPALITLVVSYPVLWLGEVKMFQAFLLTPVLAMSSLLAPIMTLLLAAFAGNKVEGLAVSKLASMLLLTPLLGYVAGMPWEALGWPFPPYWISQVFMMVVEGEGGYFPRMVLGFGVQLFWLGVLHIQFKKKLE